MTFLQLLLVLGLRRLEFAWPVWLVRSDRQQHWLNTLAGKVGEGQRLWWLGVALPVLAVLMVTLRHGLLVGLLSFLLGTLLLLWLLGARSEFRQLEELLVRGRMNDAPGFALAAEDAFAVSGESASSACQQALLDQLLSRSLAVFIAIFWLILGGFPVVLFYCLNQAWVTRQGRSEGLSVRVHQLLMWLPQRLLLLCMALAGNYATVMDRMAGHWWHAEDSAMLLREVAQSALGENCQAVDGDLAAATDQLEALQGLLLRCLAIWLIMAALWVMLW